MVKSVKWTTFELILAPAFGHGTSSLGASAVADCPGPGGGGKLAKSQEAAEQVEPGLNGLTTIGPWSVYVNSYENC